MDLPPQGLPPSSRGRGTMAKKNTNEPRMNPPSREAMAGKLQIYADTGRYLKSGA
jgi:hypothetical protein